MRSPRLVCLGNLTVDDIVEPDDSEHPLCAGGDAFYGALAARLVLDDVEMVAPIGFDLPDHVHQEILKNGFSSAGLRVRDTPTLRNRIRYQTPDSREVTMLSEAADFEALSPRFIDVPAAFLGADAFMILAMTLDAQRDLVEGCRRGGKASAMIALDPQEEYIEGNETDILSLVSRLDLFMPSLDEVRRLLGHDDAKLAARLFADLGPRYVVIKLGSAGSLIYDAAANREISISACPSVVTDTTGCGDAYCAAFVGSLICNPGDMLAAGRSGAVAASFAIEGFGTDGLMNVSREAFQSRLLSFH